MSKHLPTRHFRRGLALAELLVAATLLVAGIAFVAQGTVQTQRLMQDMRYHNLALDELANQLERITAMARPEREQALADLKPSETIRSVLADVSLKAEEFNDEDGSRIQMSIQWDRRGPSSPLILVGWVHLTSISPASQTSGERNPRDVQ